jgi:hypothetical protein
VYHAGLQPEREVRHLFPNTDDRPGDVYIPLYYHGRGAALDITVPSPLQTATVTQVAARAGNQSQQAKTLFKNAGEVLCNANLYGESDSGVRIAKRCVICRRIEHSGPDRA